MRKKVFTLILGVMLCGVSPAFAMEHEVERKSPTSTPIKKVNIYDITPVRTGMNVEEQNEAACKFLEACLTEEYEFKATEIFEKRNHTCKKEIRDSIRYYTYTTYILNDGSEWVKKERLEHFLGHLYLKKAIDDHNLNNLRVVDTRFCLENKEEAGYYFQKQEKFPEFLLIDSQDFSTYVRWMGDEEYIEDNEADQAIQDDLFNLVKKARYTDKHSGNLRKKDDKVYIIDTDYHSFSL